MNREKYNDKQIKSLGFGGTLNTANYKQKRSI